MPKLLWPREKSILLAFHLACLNRLPRPLYFSQSPQNSKLPSRKLKKPLPTSKSNRVPLNALIMRLRATGLHFDSPLNDLPLPRFSCARRTA